jgi:hypothetical protein
MPIVFIKDYQKLLMNQKLYSTLFILTSVVVLTGCLGPRIVNKWVAHQYDEVPSPAKNLNDYMTVKSLLTKEGNAVSTTERSRAKVLPLLLYWHWYYKNESNIHPLIPENNFTKTVLSYGNKHLKHKLEGQKIELTLEEIPNNFILDDEGQVFWVILYAITIEKMSIKPSKNNLVVSYRVIQPDQTVTKSGSITVDNPDKDVAFGPFQSIKKRTWRYLSDYDDMITVMSKTAVDKIVVEIAD